MPQKRRKRGKRRQVGMTIGHHTQLGAGRPLEHPGWNLKPTVGIGTAQITAKNNSVRFLDSFVNADPKSKPRVPWVQQFPKLSSVGVPKPCCSTRYVRIRASAISRRTSLWLEEKGQRPAMQRAGTLRYMGPPRPGPLLNRPRGDKCSEQGRPSQANRGPKNLGRSLVRQFRLALQPIGRIRA